MEVTRRKTQHDCCFSRSTCCKRLAGWLGAVDAGAAQGAVRVSPEDVVLRALPPAARACSCAGSRGRIFRGLLSRVEAIGAGLSRLFCGAPPGCGLWRGAGHPRRVVSLRRCSALLLSVFGVVYAVHLHSKAEELDVFSSKVCRLRFYAVMSNGRLARRNRGLRNMMEQSFSRSRDPMCLLMPLRCSLRLCASALKRRKLLPMHDWHKYNVSVFGTRCPPPRRSHRHRRLARAFRTSLRETRCSWGKLSRRRASRYPSPR